MERYSHLFWTTWNVLVTVPAWCCYSHKIHLYRKIRAWNTNLVIHYHNLARTLLLMNFKALCDKSGFSKPHVLLNFIFFTCGTFRVCMTRKTRNISLVKLTAGKPYFKHRLGNVLVVYMNVWRVPAILVMWSLCSQYRLRTAQYPFTWCIVVIFEGYDCLLTNELWLCCYQQGFYWTAPSYLEHAGGNSLLSVEKVLQKTFDACDCKRSVYIKAAIICYHVLLRIVAFDNHFIQHGGSGGATPDGVLRLQKFL